MNTHYSKGILICKAFIYKKKSQKNKLNVKKLMECTRRVHIWGAYNKLHLAEGMLELKLHFITFSRKISSSIVFMVVYQEIYSTKHSQRLIFHGFYLSSSSKKSFTIETWFLIVTVYSRFIEVQKACLQIDMLSQCFWKGISLRDWKIHILVHISSPLDEGLISEINV